MDNRRGLCTVIHFFRGYRIFMMCTSSSVQGAEILCTVDSLNPDIDESLMLPMGAQLCVKVCVSQVHWAFFCATLENCSKQDDHSKLLMYLATHTLKHTVQRQGGTPLSALRLTMKRIVQLQSKAISQWRHSLVVVGLVQQAIGYSLRTTKNLLKPKRSPLE